MCDKYYDRRRIGDHTENDCLPKYRSSQKKQNTGQDQDSMIQADHDSYGEEEEEHVDDVLECNPNPIALVQHRLNQKAASESKDTRAILELQAQVYEAKVVALSKFYED